MSRPLLRSIGVAVAGVWLMVVGVPAQTVTLEVILERADRYVARFVDAFSNVVAEEHYVQDVDSESVQLPGRPPLARAHRDTRADYVLLKVGGPLEWRPYRDVFEVDGKPLRDRDERLARLFLRPSPTAADQAARIAQESARYNIGLPRRTLNTPVLPVLFLEAAIQPRFRFTLGRRDGAVGDRIWIVEYREEARPTLIRGLSGGEDTDVQTSGRFWIDADTGRVVRTELIVSASGLRARIITAYRDDARLGIAVPAEMDEEYELDRTRVTARATYTNVRRFEVETTTGEAVTR